MPCNPAHLGVQPPECVRYQHLANVAERVGLLLVELLLEDPHTPLLQAKHGQPHRQVGYPSLLAAAAAAPPVQLLHQALTQAGQRLGKL